LLHELERRALDAEEVSDQRREALHRPALLPAEDGRELLRLLVRRAVVDEHAHAPVPFRHHLWSVGDHRDAAAGDVGPVDLAFRDVEHERDAAVAVGRPVVERHVARAHQVARAGLEVGALDVPGHGRSFRVEDQTIKHTSTSAMNPRARRGSLEPQRAPKRSTPTRFETNSVNAICPTASGRIAVGCAFGVGSAYSNTRPAGVTSPTRLRPRSAYQTLPSGADATP